MPTLIESVPASGKARSVAGGSGIMPTIIFILPKELDVLASQG
jgi:hypothetical protein